VVGVTVSDCFTCAVNAGQIQTPGGTVYEDQHWVADHGVDRLIRGYMVLKPRRHVHEVADLLPAESASLGRAMQLLHAAMRSALGTDRIYSCSFAETVPHLHFHLLPRYPDMPAVGPALVPVLFSQKWACSLPEAQDAAARVRDALASIAEGAAGDDP